MKILRIGIYIVDYRYKEFSRNISGYGRSVWDISRFSKKSGNEEYLFTFANRKPCIIDDVVIISGKKNEIIKKINIYSLLKNLLSYFRIVFSIKIKLRQKIAYIYYSLIEGYIFSVLKVIKPDVVHIHGLTFGTVPFIELCIKHHIPFVVTLHGLNMETEISNFEKKLEIEWINKLNRQGYNISVIGSNMINTISKYCLISNPKNLFVINHGIDEKLFNRKYEKSVVKEELGISNDSKVILSVGSINYRRNQRILMTALTRMTHIERKNIKLYIVGEGDKKNELIQLSKENKLEENVIFTGFLDYDSLSKLYSVANLTVITSLVEGFGRPILESFLFGVPVLAFDDLDAVNDLHIENGMFLISRSETNSLDRAIIDILSMKINNNMIESFALQKTWAISIQMYNELYCKSISDLVDLRE